MKRLGYDRYVAQGGDWGGQIVDLMGAQAPPGLLGIHTNFPGAVPADVAAAVQSGGPAPSGLDDEETRLYEKLKDFFATDVAYALEMGTHPQTLYGIADSPVGLAAWMLDHDATSLALIARVFDGQAEGLTRDDVLDNITLLLADEHGGLFGTSLSGKQVRLLRPEGRLHPGSRERLSGRALSGCRGVGRRRPIPTSSTTTSSTRAGTSPPGSSRSCSLTRSARASGRCASDRVRSCAHALARRGDRVAQLRATRPRRAARARCPREPLDAVHYGQHDRAATSPLWEQPQLIAEDARRRSDHCDTKGEKSWRTTRHRSRHPALPRRHSGCGPR